MTTQWLMAKYVSDIERHEPLNIGIILLRDGEAQARFIGQRPDGSIDGRHAKYVRSTETYRAWVQHWLSLANQTDPQALLRAARSENRGENYFLEVGGEMLLGDSNRADPIDILDNLFSRLVDDTPDVAVENITRLSEKVMTGLQRRLSKDIIRESVVRVKHDDVVDELNFDYRYNNGRPHLMRKVSLTLGDSRSWDRVHAASWAFRQIQTADDPLLKGADLIALVKLREEDRALRDQVRQLEARAHVVDVSDAPSAQQQLADLIGE